jgi:hypothetical protein
MAFPSSTGTQVSLQQAWQSSVAWAARVKSTAQSVRNKSAAGPVTSSDIWLLDTMLYDARTQFAIDSAVPGIAAYGQEQSGSATISQDFSAMTTQVDNVRTWVLNNFPKDGNGYTLERTRTADARFADREFATNAPGMATFRSALDALIATIN